MQNLMEGTIWPIFAQKRLKVLGVFRLFFLERKIYHTHFIHWLQTKMNI